MTSNPQLLQFALRYPYRILANLLLGCSGAIFNGVSATLMVPVLLALLGQSAIFKTAPPLIQTLLAPFNSLPEAHRLLAMASVIILVILLKNLATYASLLASSSLSRALTSDLQEAGLKLLLNADLDFFTKAKAGDLMNRLGGEMSRATTAMSASIQLVILIVTIFVFLGILLSLSWQLTLIATFLLPIAALINQNLIARSKQIGKLITNVSQDYASGLIETFAGIRLVKATGSEQQEFKRFQRLIRDRERLEFQSRLISSAVGPIGETTNIIALFLLVLCGRILFADQLDALSAILLTYLVVLFRLLPFIPQLNSLRESFARSSASIEVVHDLLRLDNKSFITSGILPLQGIGQGIQFHQVSFAYPNSPLVLKNINLTIPKGTTLALVGSSGAGKSTLVDLLPRFYDITAGSIQIDGVDLREYDLKSLRQAMGIVSQDTFLFNDTVRNNIAYGCSNITDAEILAAIKQAHADEFIARLSQGLDTMIGDRGVMLSGGQRQRIAIARAVLGNPDILILDEATSALDTVSERYVQAALDQLSRDRTVIVIAHRLSTVQKANQIAVMERGQIVELGTHSELLQRNGHYSRLYAMQFAESARPQNDDRDQLQLLSQASYEFRSRLNSMLGSLGLLADGLVDDASEQNEFAEEAYNSAIEMFKTVRQLERSTEGVDAPGANQSVSSHRLIEEML